MKAKLTYYSWFWNTNETKDIELHSNTTYFAFKRRLAAFCDSKGIVECSIVIEDNTSHSKALWDYNALSNKLQYRKEL